MTASWQGRVVDERYELEALLGEGGMGSVYRARHRFTGAGVALKLLHPHIGAIPEVAARFQAEARAPAAIGHPGIVRVTDAGATREGDLYLVMELLEGETFGDWLARSRAPATETYVAAARRPETFRIALEALDALGAAHAAGIVHRDLKPENVFLVGPSATVKLLDFGIAKVLGDDIKQTATGSMMGTVSYMSPEQVRDAAHVDHRTDLWAMGIMLYEAILGHRPFDAPAVPEIMVNILSKSAAPPSSLIANCSQAMDAFFARALARDPNHRYSSAAEMAAAVRALVAAETQAAVAVASTSHASSPPAASNPPVTSNPPATSNPPVASNPPPPPQAMVPEQPPAHALAVQQRSSAIPSSGAFPPPIPSTTPSPRLPSRSLAPWAIIVGLIVLFTFGVLSVILGMAVIGSRASAPAPVGAPAPAAPHHEGPRVESEDDFCRRTCAEAQRCTGVSDGRCLSSCVSSPDFRKCAHGAHDCNGIYGCALSNNCGGEPPHGNASCKQVAECQTSCLSHGATPECGCACLRRLAADRIPDLFAYNGCAVNKCRACNYPIDSLACEMCFAMNCKPQINRCNSR